MKGIPEIYNFYLGVAFSVQYSFGIAMNSCVNISELAVKTYPDLRPSAMEVSCVPLGILAKQLSNSDLEEYIGGNQGNAPTPEMINGMFLFE